MALFTHDLGLIDDNPDREEFATTSDERPGKTAGPHSENKNLLLVVKLMNVVFMSLFQLSAAHINVTAIKKKDKLKEWWKHLFIDLCAV